MFEEIVGSSQSLRKVLTAVDKVASTDSTVLILGETGTRKELIARAIHKRSGRFSRAFIRVSGYGLDSGSSICCGVVFVLDDPGVRNRFDVDRLLD
jgi:transcriptional regulator of aromatic amino acid metabolism